MAKKSKRSSLYPKPEPFNPPLGPNVVQVDANTKRITVNRGEPAPPGCDKQVALIRLNFDLKARLRKYNEACIELILPYCGDQPEKVSDGDWENASKRCRLVGRLPDAPAEVQDAVAGLKTIDHLMKELTAEGEISTHVQHAICWAIDLGLIMQQCIAQMLFDERKTEASLNANSSKSQASEEQSKLAEIEFNRRMTGSVTTRMKTATLKNMSLEKQHDGTLKYGGFSTLKRYCKTWKSLTPLE